MTGTGRGSGGGVRLRKGQGRELAYVYFITVRTLQDLMHEPCIFTAYVAVRRT